MKKVIILFSIIIFITSSAVQSFEKIKSSEKTENEEFYGFIVGSITHQNDSYENKINCNIRQMVNDLLRENIPIYWLAEEILIYVRNIVNGEINIEQNEMFFSKGSFIIPFTGDDLKDNKICLTILDYNKSSEIIKINQFKVPVYIMSNQLEVNAYLLTEVKIAKYVNYLTTPETAYLKIAGDCGFFTIDYIADESVDKNLRISNYNVLICPGSVPFPLIPSVIDILQEELKRNSTTSAFRRFVNNGGGYIGSCYGVFLASYCMFPLPAYYIRQYNNPDLRTFGIAAISDVISGMTIFGGSEVTTVRLMNDSHPVTYGIDPLVKCEFYYGGPKILKVGENSEIIGRYQNCSLRLRDTPTWVSSKFGNGRVFLFSNHPEYYVFGLENKDFKNETISNALYYTTYKEKLIFQTTRIRESNFINNSWQKTKNLENYLEKTLDLFNEIRIDINSSKEHLISFFTIFDREEYVYDSISFIYLNDSLESLTNIEKIYHLFEDDMEFLNNLSSFKDEILSIANFTSSELKNFNEKIFFLIEKSSPPFILIKKLIKRFLLRNLFPNFKVIIRNIPQIYFNSEKFLRYYWYEFETDIAYQ